MAKRPVKKGNQAVQRGRPRKKRPDEPPARSTKAQIVEAARTLFWAKGYEATSIAEICQAARVNTGSLYYFFRTKEELLLAVLDRYVELLRPEVVEPVLSRVADPMERVFGILRGYRQMLVMSDYRQGCPIGNLALEMSEKSEAVRKKIALNFENWRLAVRDCLMQAADPFPPRTDFDRLSAFILTVMEGAVMQARAYRSVEVYDAAVASLRDYLKHLMTKPA